MKALGYAAMLVGSVGLFFVVRHFGEQLPAPAAPPAAAPEKDEKACLVSGHPGSLCSLPSAFFLAFCFFFVSCFHAFGIPCVRRVNWGWGWSW